MAYINGKEILSFSVCGNNNGNNSGNGEITDGIILNDVKIDKVSVNTTIMGGVVTDVRGTMLDVEISDGENTKTKIYSMGTDPITPDVIKSGTNILGIVGNYTGVGDSAINLNNVSVVPTSIKPNTSIPSYIDYTLSDGNNTVTKCAIGASVDEITPENIREGKNILGVVGTFKGEPDLYNTYCYIDPASTSGKHTYEFTGPITNCSYGEIASNGGLSGNYDIASKQIVISKGVIGDTFKDLGAGWQNTDFDDVIVPTGKSFIIWSKSSNVPSGTGLTVHESFGTRTMNGSVYNGYLCSVASGTKNIILW